MLARIVRIVRRIADAVAATVRARWVKRAAVALVIADHVAAMVNATMGRRVRAARPIAGRVRCARTVYAKPAKAVRIAKTIVRVLAVMACAPWARRAGIAPWIVVPAAATTFAKRARRVRAVPQIVDNASFAAMGPVRQANRVAIARLIAVACAATRFARAPKIVTTAPVIADRAAETELAKRGKTVCRAWRIAGHVAAMELATRVSRVGIVRATARVAVMASVQTVKRATVALRIANRRAAMVPANAEKRVRVARAIVAVRVAIRHVGMASAGLIVARTSARVPMIVERAVVAMVNAMVASPVRHARSIARHCVVTDCVSVTNPHRARRIVTSRYAETPSAVRANLPAIANKIVLDLVAPVRVATASVMLRVAIRRAIAQEIVRVRVA